MKHGEFKIDAKFNITGRGQVFVFVFEDNKKGIVLNNGDTFSNEGKHYKIRGIETFASNRISPTNVGLLVTEIE